jgi:Lar family restriction alleviation protein
VSTLLPCPFCGERDELYPAYRVDKDGKCMQPPYAIDCLGCGIDVTPRDGMNAKDAWNRRAGEKST